LEIVFIRKGLFFRYANSWEIGQIEAAKGGQVANDDDDQLMGEWKKYCRFYLSICWE
jgi:hypothetical protein